MDWGKDPQNLNILRLTNHQLESSKSREVSEKADKHMM